MTNEDWSKEDELNRRLLQNARNFMHTVPVDPPMKSGYVESGIIRVVFHPEQDSEEVEEIAEDRGFHKVEDGVYECDTDGLESIDFPR